jgi:hypothetical protein
MKNPPGRFAPADVDQADGDQLLSWIRQILPAEADPGAQKL